MRALCFSCGRGCSTEWFSCTAFATRREPSSCLMLDRAVWLMIYLRASSVAARQLNRLVEEDGLLRVGQTGLMNRLSIGVQMPYIAYTCR